MCTDLPVEMTDQEYIDVMVWHRGLAVPAARTTMEAIMWHGNKHSDARKTVEELRALSKADRDAIVEFLDAI